MQWETIKAARGDIVIDGRVLTAEPALFAWTAAARSAVRDKAAALCNGPVTFTEETPKPIKGRNRK